MDFFSFFYVVGGCGPAGGRKKSRRGVHTFTDNRVHPDLVTGPPPSMTSIHVLFDSLNSSRETLRLKRAGKYRHTDTVMHGKKNKTKSEIV